MPERRNGYGKLYPKIRMKRIICGLLSVWLLFSMAACSTQKTESGSSSETADEEITLKIWESTEGPDKFIREAGETFQKIHPNIHVVYENVELGDARNQIALDGPAGIGADVFATSHDTLGELVSGGHILPTDDPETVSENLLPACLDAVTYGGTMYGYPVSAETYALFYNRAYLQDDEVPKTFEEVRTFSEAFEEANPGKYGFMMNVATGYYTVMFLTNGGNRLFGERGEDAASPNLNTPEAVAGMRAFQSLRPILDVPAADIADDSICASSFSSGNAAMYVTGLWNVNVFEKAGVDFCVTTLPSLPGSDEPAVSFSGTRVMQVSAYTEHPEEAAMFAKFLLTNEMQKLRFTLTGTLPATTISVDSPYAESFSKQLSYAVPMPALPEVASFWETLKSASANIWNGADVQKELDAANAAVSAR